MKLKTIINWACVLILIFTITGCKKKSSPPAEPNETAGMENTEPGDTNTIPERKSIEEYQAEAEKEITKQNYKDSLDKLEEEIEQDTSGP